MVSLAGLPAQTAAHPLTLSYAQVEQLAKRLAERMQSEWGGELAHFHFTAVPRGGLIVLGMLAYWLNLTRTQLLPVSDKPTVVVDDCAVSGTRFRQYLTKVTYPTVIFTPLLSHPSLRQAILTQTARVTHCLSASDLSDTATNRYPDPAEYTAWQTRWHQRQPDAYWVGLPETVVFPWSEPDTSWWNPQSKQFEEGWRFGSPNTCLKNWHRLGLPLRPNLPPPQYEVPAGVAFRVSDSPLTIGLYHTPSDQLFTLVGVGADMWRALAAYGTISATADFLHERYQAPRDQLEQEIATFTATLIAQHLLAKVA